MHSEIQHTQRQFLELFERQRACLLSRTDAYLEELLHRSEDLLQADAFSVRAGAEINRAACMIILEERGKAL